MTSCNGYTTYINNTILSIQPPPHATFRIPSLLSCSYKGGFSRDGWGFHYFVEDSGFVEFGEFIQMIGRWKDLVSDSEHHSEHEIQEAFRMFDKDGDGFINAKELKQVVLCEMHGTVIWYTYVYTWALSPYYIVSLAVLLLFSRQWHWWCRRSRCRKTNTIIN